MRSALAAALLAVLLPAAVDAAPITFQAPSPLDDGQLAVGSQATWATAPDGPPPEHAHERSLSIAAVAMAALLPRLTAAVAVPFVERRVTAIGPTGDAIERRVRGAGDLTASLAFTAVHRPVASGRLLLAPFASLKTPTGSSAPSDVWQAPDAGPLAPATSGGASWVVCPGLQATVGSHTIEAAAEVPLRQPSDQHVAIAARVGYRITLER